MAAQQTPFLVPRGKEWGITRVARFPRLRALAWDDSRLYASRGYSLLRADVKNGGIKWHSVARHRPAWWRNLSSTSRLGFRLCRDGFHALAVLSSGHLAAVVPGAVLALAPGETEFRITHTVLRGTRPLHLAVTPSDHIFWGEYFDNRHRNEVHIYASTDKGATWSIAHTFPKGAIRHVHSIVYDKWADCLWVLTGDDGSECRILKASCDFRDVEVVMSGNQQARAVALVPTPDALYFSSDTPLEANHVYRLDRHGKLSQLTGLSSSSIYGCRVGEAIFFSTMVEPSLVNPDNHARLYGSPEGGDWCSLGSWEKDRWPMGLFQFGNIFLPDGENTSNFLALSTVAVRAADLETSIWSLNPA